MGKPSKKDVGSVCTAIEVPPTVDEDFESKSTNEIQSATSAADKILYGIVPGRKKSFCPCCSGHGISKVEGLEPKHEDLKEYDNSGVTFDINTEFLILQESDPKNPSTGPKKRGRKRRKLLEPNTTSDTRKLLLDSIAIPVWRLVEDYDFEFETIEEEEEVEIADLEEPTEERIQKRHFIHELEEKIRHNWENKPFIKKMQVQLRKLLAEVTIKNPKGRGRKPKKFLQSLLQNNVKTITTVTPSSTNVNGEAVVKRKRGRPRKYPRPDEIPNTSVTASIDIQSTCLVSTTTEEKTSTVDKGTQIYIEEDSSTITKIESHIQVTETNSNDKVVQKRKRGRPPKHPKLVKIPEPDTQSKDKTVCPSPVIVTVDPKDISSLDPHSLLNWRPFSVDNLHSSIVSATNEGNLNEEFLNENYNFISNNGIFSPQTTLDMSVEQYIQLADAINHTLNENGTVTSAPTPPSNSFSSPTLPEVIPFTIELF